MDLEPGPQCAAPASAGVEPFVAGQTLMDGPVAWEGVLCGAQQILLVEDEAFVRKVTTEVLEAAGYRVLVARNAAEAVEISGRCPAPLNLLLTDVVLPGKNGIELAKEISALNREIRVLLISGYAGQLALSRSSEVQEYLAKPFSTQALLSKVRQLLEGTGAGGQGERRLRPAYGDA